MKRKTTKKVYWAVVTGTSFSSVFNPTVWYNAMAIFKTQKQAIYWVENNVYGNFKFIPVHITPVKKPRATRKETTK